MPGLTLSLLEVLPRRAIAVSPAPFPENLWITQNEVNICRFKQPRREDIVEEFYELFGCFSWS